MALDRAQKCLKSPNFTLVRHALDWVDLTLRRQPSKIFSLLLRPLIAGGISFCNLASGCVCGAGLGRLAVSRAAAAESETYHARARARDPIEEGETDQIMQAGRSPRYPLLQVAFRWCVQRSNVTQHAAHCSVHHNLRPVSAALPAGLPLPGYSLPNVREVSAR